MTPGTESIQPPPREPNVDLAGLLLAITGVLGILYALLSIVGSVLTSTGALGSIFNDPALKQHQGTEQAVSKAVGLGWSLVMGLANGFVVYGGLQMRESRSYQLAFGAAVIATVPCCFTGCCTVLSLPAGIFALMTLTRPEVKASFTN